MKKVILLAVVEGAPETRRNVNTVFELLKLNEVQAIYTTDLKMANLMLGLSVRITKLFRPIKTTQFSPQRDIS